MEKGLVDLHSTKRNYSQLRVSPKNDTMVFKCYV